MSVEFIQKRIGQNELQEARRQERQLSYLVSSDLQSDNTITDDIDQWVNRNYLSGNDFLMNWVKSVFKVENSLSFAKYLRFPLPSSEVIQEKVIPQLERVFYAQDASTVRNVNGVEESQYIQDLKPEDFKQKTFDALMNAHNSVVLTDLRDTNKPERTIIDIDRVVAIEENDRIERIAFHANYLNVAGEVKKGYLYVDDVNYIVYNDEYVEMSNTAHDLGRCPVEPLTAKRFGKKSVVKESVFSYVRAKLEEFVFLRTIQKMIEPNGGIPVTIQLDPPVGNSDNNDTEGKEGAPEFNQMGSQRAQVTGTKKEKSVNVTQAGSVVRIPIEAVTNEDGAVDSAVVQNFVNHVYIPVEALDYLNERVKEIENSIVSTLVGDTVSQSEEAKNELQIAKSIAVLENTLRNLSAQISTTCTETEKDWLGLKYGAERVEYVAVSLGSDFFLENEQTLYSNFENAPNPIERKSILIRLASIKYKTQPEELLRQKILYELMPYASDKDFDIALTREGTVTDEVFALQTRFAYFISVFEAQNGNVVEFYKMLNTSQAEAITAIKSILTKIIEDEIRKTESN